MSAPKLCKDCRFCRKGHWVVHIAPVYCDAACLRTDLVGDGRKYRLCADERESDAIHACGPDGKHWSDE